MTGTDCLPNSLITANSARMSNLYLTKMSSTILGNFVLLIGGIGILEISFNIETNNPGIPIPPPGVDLDPAISLDRCPHQFVKTFLTLFKIAIARGAFASS